MSQRKKWSDFEDAHLRRIVQEFDGDVVDWNIVAARMNQKGFRKNRK